MGTPAVIPPVIDPEPEVVEFTPAQQLKLDEILKKAMGRAGADARAEVVDLKAKLAQQDADLVETKKKLVSATSVLPKKDSKEEVVVLQAEIDEMKNARAHTVAEIDGLRKQLLASTTEATNAKGEATTQKKLNEINRAAAKSEFIDLSIVTALTAKNIVWNEADGKWNVLNDEGQPRRNTAYDLMSVDEFFEDYALKHPYLVKGQVKAGGGGTSSAGSPVGTSGRFTTKQIFGKDSSARDANMLALKNPAEYKRLKAEAREQGLIA